MAGDGAGEPSCLKDDHIMVTREQCRQAVLGSIPSLAIVDEVVERTASLAQSEEYGSCT